MHDRNGRRGRRSLGGVGDVTRHASNGRRGRHGKVACLTKATIPGGVVIDSLDMFPVESCMGDVAWEPIICRGEVVRWET